MSSALIFVILAYCTNALALIPSHPVFLYPEHRSGLRPMSDTEQISANAYDFQIVPSDQYPVVEYVNSPEATMLEYLSYPINAIATAASTALSVGKWIVVNGAMVFLGMALVIGFCGFTPFCTLTIHKPFSIAFPNFSIPYLDDAEYYFNEAYNKYREMQNYL